MTKNRSFNVINEIIYVTLELVLVSHLLSPRLLILEPGMECGLWHKLSRGEDEKLNENEGCSCSPPAALLPVLADCALQPPGVELLGLVIAGGRQPGLLEDLLIGGGRGARVGGGRLTAPHRGRGRVNTTNVHHAVPGP